jgi:hypothetical protein
VYSEAHGRQCRCRLPRSAAARPQRAPLGMWRACPRIRAELSRCLLASQGAAPLALVWNRPTRRAPSNSQGAQCRKIASRASEARYSRAARCPAAQARVAGRTSAGRHPSGTSTVRTLRPRDVRGRGRGRGGCRARRYGAAHSQLCRGCPSKGS